MALLYEHINTKEQLIEFVDHLNTLPVREKHLLFTHIFNTRSIDIAPKDFPRTQKIFFQKWWFAVKQYAVYVTVKINKKLPLEKPELKSGLYEEIYFHLNPQDYSGISQTAS